VLPTRLAELRAPEAPFPEVFATVGGQPSMRLRWCPSLALRDPAGKPVEGARYQTRCMLVKAPGAKDVAEAKWEEQPAMLEEVQEGSEAEPREASSQIWALVPGGTYRFALRVGNQHQWSDWSPESEPVPLAVAAPMPSPGDVLEITSHPSKVDSLRLEWRPFRTSPGMELLEYKIMALEWTQSSEAQEAPGGENGLVSRLRWAAQAGSPGSWPVGDRTFREVGYVTRDCLGTAGQLRPQAGRVEWKTEGLRPGMYYRFFVCARYVGLPPGAVAPLPTSSMTPNRTSQAGNFWPYEQFEHLWHDDVNWEASLSRVGLWSPIVNTSHLPQYLVRPAAIPGGALPLPVPSQEVQAYPPLSAPVQAQASPEVNSWATGNSWVSPGTEPCAATAAGVEA